MISLSEDINELSDAVRQLKSWVVRKDHDWENAVRWLSELLAIKEGELHENRTDKPS